MNLRVWTTTLGLALAACTPAAAAGPAATDPAHAGEDYAVQGEYSGEIGTGDGKVRIGVQVIALGEGKFQAVGYVGGLPGDGWNGQDKHLTEGSRQGESVVFEREGTRAEIKDQVMLVTHQESNSTAKFPKVTRKSPTLNAKPPEGALVLFDGSQADAWKNGRLSEDKLLMPGTTTKETFGSCRLHLEFRLPFQPQERGQARGNSGVYLQGRYEVQMLDSFGLEGKQNECGGIYSVKDPDVNMCLPPLTWQTYDIDYTAARYDEQGKLLASPRITVEHNGVVIHRDVELPGDRTTTAAPVAAGPEPGPIYLQDHGNPVRYRNIWVIRREP